MKNKYIYKKLKLTIVLNAMYWIEDNNIAYSDQFVIEQIGKTLASNCYINSTALYILQLS